MVATLTRPKKPRVGGSRPRLGVFTTKIAGRFRPLTVHQLAMTWWLYQAKHITARQFRIVFAAHEMHERRRYTHQEPGERPRKPSYTLDEIKALIGSQAIDADLSADVKALGRLGLVEIGSRSINFAVSIDQISLEDVAGFWSFFDQLPNTGRKVPVPRRTVRALAKGFTRGVSGMMLAILIRSLYWHRPGGQAGEEGGYRIDGRTKCSWIAEVFGISRRSVTDARATLIETGWLVPVECPQWQLNKWGQRYTVNVEAFGPKEKGGSCREAFSLAATRPSGIASPPPDNPGEIASPCLNTSSPSTKEDLKTRRPARKRSGSFSVGSRKKKSGEISPPKLTNIVPEDLRDTDRLTQLHHQAIEAGHPVKGENGRREFFALAERARSHGHDAPRLFAWLLRERRFDFITHAEEDAAMARLKRAARDRSTRQGDREKQRRMALRDQPRFVESLGDDERFVHACIITGRQHKIDPFRVAQMTKQWTRKRWDDAKLSYDFAEQQRWRPDELTGGGFMHIGDADQE